MNHIPAAIRAVGAPPKNRRALAKMRTRQNLIDAAKRLFIESGYQEATVRDIAAAAGLSTGAVFANFEDKADLFHAVLEQDEQFVAGVMRQAASLSAPDTLARLSAVFAAAYAFHLDQLSLLRAALAESWLQTPREAAEESRRRLEASALIEGLIYKGMAEGELRSGIDVALVADLIWQTYQSNYRLALHDGYGLAALNARLAAQLRIILSSFAVS